MGVMDTARTVGMALEGALPAINEEAPLVAELQAGSEEAFAYLLGVYQNPVFNLVSHILENPAEAGGRFAGCVHQGLQRNSAVSR